MAAGRPVVATDLGGCRELIVDGVTGCLVPVGDPGAMAERIIQVLSLPDRGRSMGAAGSERIRSEFSIAAMVERFEALFLNVCGKNVPAS
jgi:glycosyltransferase involved in cell wall biosynthesis